MILSIFFPALIIIGLSFTLPVFRLYKWRWIFGVGAILAFVCIGIVSTHFRQQQADFNFTDKEEVYRGVVVDLPQSKPHYTAYKVFIPDLNKYVVCYFEKNAELELLSPSDIFLFYGKIKPFKSSGNSDEFDYSLYMYNKGYAGAVSIYGDSWVLLEGEKYTSLQTEAAKCRAYILDFYKSLDLSHDEYAILSGLTLGYTDDLSDDLQQAFRTTGTVHILSVSGLHVGIIFMIVASMLSFIPQRSKYSRIKYILIIFLLWVYAFITGLSPAVVRAGLMLSVFCVSQIVARKDYSLNTLFISAFLMLLYNPFNIFDIGFQLSFTAVLSILCLYPKMYALYKHKNTYVRYIWGLSCVSIAAQLGTFPLCLYYFGIFPTYFLATNLIIVPLVSLMIYVIFAIVIAKGFCILMVGFEEYIFYLPLLMLKGVIFFMVLVMDFFAKFPFAQIVDIEMSLLDLFSFFTIIISLCLVFFYKRRRWLIVTLFSILLCLSFHLYDNLTRKNELIVYNRKYTTEIKWNIGKQEFFIRERDISDYKLIELGPQNLLVIKENIWKEKIAKEKYEIDFLLLTQNNSLSLYSLLELFSVKNIIVDSSLSKQTRNRIVNESQILGIPCYDVSSNGAYRMIF